MISIGKKGINAIIFEENSEKIKEYTNIKTFEGKKDQLAIIEKENIVILGGGGKTSEDIRSISCKILSKARTMKLENICLKLIKKEIKERDIKAMVEGAVLGNYDDERFKSKKEKKQLNIYLDIGEEYKKIVEEAYILAQAQNYVREIDDSPANVITPETFSKKAHELAKKLNLKITELKEKELKEMGMNGILAVGKGSIIEPRLIILEYNGGNEEYVLVGKGVTFDSGGICLKPSKNMELMKYDKSGACICLGVIKACAELKLPIKLTVMLPLVENLPSMKSTKPGDIIKMYNGKTVEIINTDAEGRLILADALAYASKRKPKAIIDLATLTGAIVVCLGRHAIGAFTNNQSLMNELLEASKKSDERVWQLPLWEEYSEMMKGKYADLANISGTHEAGSITAAAFLKEFVDVPWIHLDIAGVDVLSTEHRYLGKGATGTGTRLIIEFLKNKK